MKENVTGETNDNEKKSARMLAVKSKCDESAPVIRSRDKKRTFAKRKE